MMFLSKKLGVACLASMSLLGSSVGAAHAATNDSGVLKYELAQVQQLDASLQPYLEKNQEARDAWNKYGLEEKKEIAKLHYSGALERELLAALNSGKNYYGKYVKVTRSQPAIKEGDDADTEAQAKRTVGGDTKIVYVVANMQFKAIMTIHYTGRTIKRVDACSTWTVSSGASIDRDGDTTQERDYGNLSEAWCRQKWTVGVLGVFKATATQEMRVSVHGLVHHKVNGLPQP